MTKLQIIYIFNQISKNYLLSNAIENVFILSNVYQNRSNLIEKSFNKKIKYEFFARRVEFEKKLTKKRFVKVISRSLTLLLTIIKVSKLIVQFDRYINK